MFATCCTGNISPKGTEDNQNHLNPIHLRLANRNNSSKNETGKIKKLNLVPIQHSRTKEDDVSAVLYTEKHRSTTKTNLIHSIFIPNSTSISSSRPVANYFLDKEPFASQDHQEVVFENVQLKYSRLQDKYIGVLERTNDYLQKELDKSRAISQNESKSQTSRGRSNRNRITSQLYELKRRLNNIDLSGIKKLATLREDNIFSNQH